MNKLYKVLIFGRPNVGKSSLMNALLGYRRSIVYDEPGTTLDDIKEKTNLGKGDLLLWDSEGVYLEEKPEEIKQRLQSADLVLYVIDAQVGFTPFDKEFMPILKSLSVPILLCANKSEGIEYFEVEKYKSLNFETLLVSAAHRKNIQEVKDFILKHQPDPIEKGEPKKVIKVALIGKPNSGKSTLMNTLTRETVSRVSPLPLTTRDSVSYEIEDFDTIYKLIDTAGMRRPRSQKSDIEIYSISNSTQALETSDVILLMINATEEVTHQDLRLLDLITRKGKSVLVLLNMWDALKAPEQKIFLDRMPKIIQDNPYLTISAMKEQGTYEILPLVKKLYTQANKRLTTSTLNEVVKRIVEKNPPPSSGRGNFNILYASQVKTSPPTFVFFLNRKEALPSSYQHYLSNQLKERLKLKGQSIRLLYRSK